LQFVLSLDLFKRRNQAAWDGRDT